MKKHVAHIDFETRSTVDLKKAGAHVYAQHETTDALCMAYAIDDGPVKIWILGESFPDILLQAVKSKNVTFMAHNAAFEFLIWNGVCVKKYGWPILPMNRFDCTMIRAYSMGLPGTLEMASKAVGMSYEKDMKGHRIMLQLCKPRYLYDDGSFEWWNEKDSTPKLDIKNKYQMLYRYCKQDIIVERELDKRVLPLSQDERKLWLLDQKINYNGVHLDEKAAEKAIKIVKKEQDKFNTAIKRMTDNEVNTVNSHIALRKWVNSQGVKCESIGKAEVIDLLELDDLPDNVRNILLLRQEASKSSTAKLKSMITSKSDDSRVRGCFQFYGAASTGRWAGRRIQLQNLTRPKISQKEIEYIMQKLKSAPVDEARDYLSIFYGSAINPISNCLRAMLTAAPGKTLIAIDFNAIEGRVLAWLAGEENTLNIFRSHGKIYEHTACQIHGLGNNIKAVNDEQYLIGKVATLALGFQGGVGAFQSMAKVYFIKIPDEQADIIKLQWRRANPRIVSYWYDLERAAIAAVQNPNQKFACGPKGRHATFLKKGSFLFCRLPSGRAICYPYPKMKLTKTPWGEPKNALHYKGIIFGKFVSRVAYGGLIAENVTQATARDLLKQSLFNFDNQGHKIVMHVHDEIVIEVDKNSISLDEAKRLMLKMPLWAKDLPVAAKGWQGQRYRK